MWVINICAFLCACLTLARIFHRPIVYTVPVTFCALMIVLQFLAYYNLLSAIDWIAGGGALCLPLTGSFIKDPLMT